MASDPRLCRRCSSAIEVGARRSGRPRSYCSPACAKEAERQRKAECYLAHRDEVRTKHAHYRSANKEAIRRRDREYYAKNRTRIREDQKRWYQSIDPDLRRARRVLGHARRREKDNAQAAQYRALNRDRVNASILAWRQRNPDRTAQNDRAKAAMRRARIRSSPRIERVDADYVFDRDRGICGICGEPVRPGEKWHIDHVLPLSKGGSHTYDNVQLSHALCNLKKSDRVPEDRQEVA